MLPANLWGSPYIYVPNSHKQHNQPLHNTVLLFLKHFWCNSIHPSLSSLLPFLHLPACLLLSLPVCRPFSTSFVQFPLTHMYLWIFLFWTIGFLSITYSSFIFSALKHSRQFISASFFHSWQCLVTNIRISSLLSWSSLNWSWAILRNSLSPLLLSLAFIHPLLLISLFIHIGLEFTLCVSLHTHTHIKTPQFECIFT